MKKPRVKHRDDIVAATLSELILFFLFFCLILLGGVAAYDPLEAAAKRLEPAPPVDPTPPDPEPSVDVKIPPDEPAGSHTRMWVIGFSETDGDLSYTSGGKEIPKDLSSFVKDHISDLREAIDAMGEDFHAIEVIGHTDEQALKDRAKAGSVSLDEQGAFEAIKSGDVVELRPNDNVGLAMIRAIDVAGALREHLEEDYPILPLSAGPYQLFTANGEKPGVDPVKGLDEDPSRRRVEIRLRGKIASKFFETAEVDESNPAVSSGELK